MTVNQRPCLELEPLESRATPSDLFGFQRLEVALPPSINDLWTAERWLRVETFLGQWGQGIPWKPGQIIQLDLTPAQAWAFYGNANTTARTVLDIGNFLNPTAQGHLPILMVPPQFQGWNDGVIWEETSLHMGWWSADWLGGIDMSAMPPGPQAGQNLFAPPDYFVADALLMQGNPYWWWFI